MTRESGWLAYAPRAVDVARFDVVAFYPGAGIALRRSGGLAAL